MLFIIPANKFIQNNKNICRDRYSIMEIYDLILYLHAQKKASVFWCDGVRRIRDRVTHF
jgi:hypothetical protein